METAGIPGQERDRRPAWVVPILFAFALPVLVSFALAAALGEAKWEHAPFHSVLETLGGAIALGVSLFLLARRAYGGQPDHFEWVVAALVSMGLLDLVHAMLGVSPAFFWSRALPTFLGGILMALVWVPIGRVPSALRRHLPLIAALATLPFCAALVAAPEAWPRLFDAEGRYTPLAKGLNIVGGLAFLAAAARFHRAFRSTGAREDYVFFSHCLLFGAAGVLFMLSHMWGSVWWFFHLLRFGAYAVVLTFVVRSVRAMAAQRAERLRFDLREAEREISDRNERLDLALEAAQLGTWDWDIATGNIAWSPQHEMLMGYVPGKPHRSYAEWAERLHPEDREKAEAQVREALEGKRDFKVMYRVVWSRGEVRWLTTRGRVFFDKKGNARRMLGVLWDTTESKRIEEDLRSSREQLDAILQNVFDAIVVQDAKGRLLYANHSAARLLGLPSVEALRSLPPDYFRNSLEVTDEFGSPIPYHDLPGPRARRGETVPPRDIRWRILATGEERWVQAGSRAVTGEDGAIRFIIVYGHDITQRRGIEESLRKSQEMLRQSQKLESIGRLAGGVAHDFNNLLTAIGGFSELALASLPEDDPVRPHLIEIRKAGDRAARLTQQLLAFGRKQLLAPKRMNLNRLVSGMHDLLRRLIGEDIQIDMELTQDLLDIRMDPSQMEQVILNLAINARDAMPKGGRLVLRTWNGAAEPPAGPHGSVRPRVCLAVSDTGHGMDAATRERIFEPFFTTKAFGQGSGLGLATVHGIVAQSGGSIAVESEPNRGTTFQICMPAATDPPENPENGTIPPIARGKEAMETLLVAEDDDSVRRLASSVLRSRGYRVLEAADGEAALRLQADYKGPIHLVVSDMIMPHLNGRDLAERIQESRKDIPVLFMSGYADMETVGTIEVGRNRAFLPKPFSAEELLSAVGRLLQETLIQS